MRQVLCGIVVLSLPLLLPTPARAQDDPKAIIEKAIKAHGGEEKMLKMAMVRTKGTGTMELTGINIAFSVDSIVAPDKLRTELSLDVRGQQIPTKEVFDGEKGWVSGVGMTLELSGPLLEELKQTVAAKRVESLVPLLKDKMYTLSPAGETTVDGKKAVGVKVSAKGLRDSTLYFDKDSGLLVKAVRRMLNLQQKEVAGETIYSDFKDFGGVKVATKMVAHQDGKKFMEAQITEVKVLDKVDASEFAKP